MTGCTSGRNEGETPTPTPPALSAASRQALLKADLDRQWQETGLPDANRPNVDVVRFTTLFDWAEASADCLQRDGWDAAAEDGGLSATEPADPAQANAMRYAVYVCYAKYPMDPRFSVPLNESQLRYLYRYYTTTMRDCVRKQGYEISDPPSESTFVENYQRNAWTPL